MNILFLSTKLPYPPLSGAKIRDFNLIKQISKKHKIILVSFIQDEKEKENLKFLKPYCQIIKVIKERGKINLFISFVISLFSRKPFTIAKYYSPKMKQLIKKIFDDNKIDLIHCGHLHMAQYVENLKGMPKVLDEHNIEYFLIKRYIDKQKNIFKKAFVFLMQYLKLARYEPAIAQKFEHCLVVSEVDKRNLKMISSNASASVVPNGVDIDFYKKNEETKIEQNSLVFTGAMNWFPNEDAILYFYDEIWSHIKKEIDNLCLYIVGCNPSNKITNLSKQEKNIIVTGYVDDVRPYIAKSSVYIVPLRIGGGSRLKILEALSMGKAVVSTSIGCEGLNVTDNENILIADFPKEFARKTLILLRNKELCQKLGNNGRRLVESFYSWKNIYKKLDKIYDGAYKK